MSKVERKQGYFEKLNTLLDKYSKIFIVNADNVGSKQMQEIRIALRGKAVVLMGKNTMIRKAIRGVLEKHPDFERLLPHVVYNIGFVFTDADLGEVRKLLESNKVAAPAKAGAIAPVDVYVPAGPTTLGPEKTSFFQALSITTKIARGTIEILNDIHLIKKDDKVGASEASLLNMLAISPFHYGLSIKLIYDNGSLYDAKVLDITPATLLERFQQGLTTVASISLAIRHPSVASAPHLLVRGFKNVLAVSIATDYTFPLSKNIKELLSDPAKLAAASAAASAAAAPAAAAAAPAAAAAKKEEKKKEESDDGGDMGFGLFD